MTTSAIHSHILDGLTSQAYSAFTHAKQRPGSHSAKNAQASYACLESELQQKLGPNLLQLARGSRYDRYLLQYVIGSTFSDTLARNLDPRENVPHYDDFNFISGFLNRKINAAPYTEISELVRMVTAGGMYSIVEKALNHARSLREVHS